MQTYRSHGTIIQPLRVADVVQESSEGSFCKRSVFEGGIQLKVGEAPS